MVATRVGSPVPGYLASFSVRDPEVYWVPSERKTQHVGHGVAFKASLKPAWSKLDSVPPLPPIDGFQHKQRSALVFCLGTHFVFFLGSPYPEPVTVPRTFVYSIKIPKHLFSTLSHCPIVWDI